MRTHVLSSAKRVVIKIGSHLVASREKGLRSDRIKSLTRDITTILTGKRQVVLVSSGAVLAGIAQMKLKGYPQALPLKQAAAAIGQSRLIRAYEKSFETAGWPVAQVLLTHQDLADRKRFLNARHTLSTLLRLGFLPIINENDTVAVDEIRFGDNDSLAGQAAQLIDADALIILSDVDGLYSADPRAHPSATLIPTVREITKTVERIAGPSTSQESQGGMRTKILAAKHAAHFGVATFIINGETRGILPEVFQGISHGTFFQPQSRSLSGRKQWIAFTLRAKGTIMVDEGAVQALQHKGRSLLPSGILHVEGQFNPGDAVTCTTPQGQAFAKGLTNYASPILRQIKGLQTRKIRQIMGTQEYEEVIHRDNLVLL